YPKPAPAVAAQLAGLAALTGRSQLTADLLQRSAPVDSPTTNTAEVITGDSTLHGAALALLAYASLGAPAESVMVLTARVERLVTGGFRPDRQAAARSAFEGPAAVLAFPITGATPLHRSGEPGGYRLALRGGRRSANGPLVGAARDHAVAGRRCSAPAAGAPHAAAGGSDITL